MKAVKNKTVKKTYTPIKVDSLKSARRLLSRLIYQLQTKEVDSRVAKDLCYLLISYVNVFKSYEFEERLEKLEKQIGVQ